MGRGWCVRCGEPWPEDKSACNTCGAADQEQRPCKSCGHYLQGSMKFCSDCGTVCEMKTVCSLCAKALHATMKFCPTCGGKPKQVSLTPGNTGLLGSRIEAAAHIPDNPAVTAHHAAPKPTPPVHAAPFTPPPAGPTPLPSKVAETSRPSSPTPSPAPSPAVPTPTPVPLPAVVVAEALPPRPQDPKSIAIDMITAETGISYLRAKRMVDMGYDLERIQTSTLGELTRIPGFDEWSARQVLEGVRAVGHPLADSVDRYEKTLTEVNDLKARFVKVSADVTAVETLMRQAMQLRSEGKVEWSVQVIIEARSHLVLKINAYVAYTREKIQARAAQPDVPQDTKEKLKRLYFFLDTALSFRDHTRAVGLCAVAQTLTGGV